MFYPTRCFYFPTLSTEFNHPSLFYFNVKENCTRRYRVWHSRALPPVAFLLVSTIYIYFSKAHRIYNVLCCTEGWEPRLLCDCIAWLACQLSQPRYSSTNLFLENAWNFICLRQITFRAGEKLPVALPVVVWQLPVATSKCRATLFAYVSAWPAMGRGH